MNRILLCLLLVGCGTQESPNHGFGYSYDEQGKTGIRVRYLDDTSPHLAFVEQMYRETMTCAGIDAPGPLVIFVPPGSIKDADNINVNGKTYLDTGTIILDNDACINGVLCKILAFQGHVMKHEDVHWLLHWSGKLTEEQQFAHDATEFTTCTNVVLP